MNAPAVYQGEVVEPSHVSQPHSYAARDFFNLVRDLVHHAGYRSENQVLSAMKVVDGYEKHVIGNSDLPHVVSEFDRAPVEDVSLRVAPGAVPSNLPAVQQIDYARLAAAIVAAQAAAKTDTHAQPVPASGVPVITDAQNPIFPNVA